MEDENEYKKLPTEDKCVHKSWKARVAGYEEAIKLFNQIDDEKSPEWNKYLGLIKKFVMDSNAVAQEKGLEAALVFVENCGHAGKTTGEVMSGIVAKCIAAPKTRTKDLASQVTLMYVEIEKPDIVQEELMKGMEHKNPKVVSACTAALTSALQQFGNKVIGIKPMVKKIPILLADRDKGVRDEMKALVVEMHRWIGPAIEPHIASLQAVVQQELRDAFIVAGVAQPIRYLKSQQYKRTEQVARSQVEGDGACDDDDGETGAGDSPNIDPYDLLDPVDILSKLPKDFFNKVEEKKWQERKEALDALEAILKTAPRLEPGDYADLVRALKKMISKDSNVILVALAVRLVGMIAIGLRNKFTPYATACVEAILEKFKEKKTNVVTALREAIDAIYPCTNLEAIMEDMMNAFNNKNPSIKCESALFLSRALCRTQPAAFNKKLIKTYIPTLVKLLDSAEPTVRDAAAEAIGTATKLVGDKSIAPYVDKLDNLKEQKIKEYAEKAEIQVKIAAPKKEKPKAVGKGDSGKSAGSADPKPVKRPATGTKKPLGKKKPAAAKPAPTMLREMELLSDEVDSTAENLFAEDVITGLIDAGNWKIRLSAVQSFFSTVQSLTPDDVNSQVLYRIINKKPGLKDTNVQVLKARLEATKYITENFPISTTAADFVINDIVNKLGEASCSSLSADNLTSLAEHCNFEHIANEGLTFAMDSQKNPKVQSEMFNWIAGAVKEFGMTINIKPLIAHSKKAISATNPNVRTSAVNLIGVLSLYVGPSIINHFDTEKPATKQLISLELEKYANNSPPTSTRNVSKSGSKASMGDDLDEYQDAIGDEPAAPVEDNRTKTDIAPLITDSLISEINDKNWKVRNEALDKLKGIITSSAPIKPSLGELPPALTARLVDSNSKLAQTALQICESLATAMGAKCKQHVRTFFPGFFQAFGDNKQWIRQAATSCVVAWCNAAGGPHVAMDGEMVFDALKTGSPVLRAELFQWIADHIPNAPPKSFPREELSVCVPLLYACIEDRSAEVRKKAGDCVLPFMLHLGYESMHKQLDKLKPGSKSVVQGALDKARPNLPIQPLPTKTKKDEPKGVKSAGALKKEADRKTVIPGKAKGIVKPSSASNRGKKDDEDTSPLLPCNNAKNQRIIDDQKLKVLKWNFTTPREEFFDLLKEQMISAGLNKQLVANMFHADFRYHLKSLEALSEDLLYNGQAMTANLDLVLKWLTLRFFDTNPSVILKGLEYLSQVFTYLIDADYTMAEYEANCFIPYLVLKVGDPKDTVRNGVKALFKQICVVYSVTKLFGYLMEGLKSKNARQRAECLECIGVLIETYGSTVLTPTPSAALKELARHIGDRDNAVRSAALNCVTNAYFLEGEKIYKMIGQISDKDLSLLEERIKRATKTRSAETRLSMVIPLTATGKPILQHEPQQELEPRRVISVDATPGEDYEEEEPEDSPPSPQPLPVEPKVISGPYGLDPVLIARLDAEVPNVRRSHVPELDLKFLDEPIPVPNVRTNIPRPATSVLPVAPPRHIPSHPIVSQQQQQTDDSQLADTIHSIASPDIHAAIRALSLISGALAGGRGASRLEERLITAVASQMRSLRSGLHSPTDTLHAYKCIASVLSNLYEPGGYGLAVGSVALSDLLRELLRVLGVLAIQDGDSLVRLLNNVCVRMLEHSDRTELICALVFLLQESIGVSDPTSPRYQELLLKCFWKTLKMIPTWDVNSIDYDTVLLRIHLFYKTFPNSYWKKTQDISETPNKTVKTLVHSMVKIKGWAITEHVTQIPDVQDSDLYHYLLKVLKQLKLDDKREVPVTQPDVNGSVLTSVSPNNAMNSRRLPKNVHEELAAILKKIGNKHHNQHALEQLHELKERHPDIDIWTFMHGSSFYFRNYVERGLRDVAEQKRLAPLHAHYKPIISDTIDINNENDDKSHVVFLEKLRALQAKAGIKTDTPNSQPRTPIDNRALTDSMNDNNLPRHTIDPQLQLHSVSQASHRSEAGMDAIKLKLQQIKSSTKR